MLFTTLYATLYAQATVSNVNLICSPTTSRSFEDLKRLVSDAKAFASYLDYRIINSIDNTIADFSLILIQKMKYFLHCYLPIFLFEIKTSPDYFSS